MIGIVTEPKTLLALSLVNMELNRAVSKHPVGFNSAHEGYAVIKEELDELWHEVKADNPKLAKEEAIQVAAMAIRFLLDVA